jgi:PPOX class probable F420-dependent enzyme
MNSAETVPATKALLSQIAAAPYVSVRTYRKNGTFVQVPVWHVELDGRFYIFTERAAYKVKRLRRNPSAALATCDWKGGNTGSFVAVSGRILGESSDPQASQTDDTQLIERMYEALVTKYGWQMRLGNLFSWASGRISGRAELEFAASSPP